MGNRTQIWQIKCGWELCVLVCVAAVCWRASWPQAKADTVRYGGVTVSGKIIQSDAERVVIDRGQNRQETIHPFRIELVFFDEEPSTLRTAKLAAVAGRFEEALAGLERIQLPDNVDAKVKQEMDYLQALCRWRLAEASANPQVMKEAADLLEQFIKQNPQHYRLWQAAEGLAQLLLSLGRQDEAQQYFALLQKAPWPEVQLRAQLASARAALAAKNFTEAEKLFDALVAQSGNEERLRQMAIVGKARVLAETGRSDEAIRLIQETLQAIRPEDIPLRGQAYNALGLAYRRAGKNKEAILAYLHVDLLYSNVPAEHVECLENLVELFAQVGQRERAEAAAAVLRERYGRTPGGS